MISSTEHLLYGYLLSFNFVIPIFPICNNILCNVPIGIPTL